MAHFQTPYCANDHTGIPMLHTNTDDYDEKSSRVYECPQCAKKIKLIRDNKSGEIKIKKFF